MSGDGLALTREIQNQGEEHKKHAPGREGGRLHGDGLVTPGANAA